MGRRHRQRLIKEQEARGCADVGCTDKSRSRGVGYLLVALCKLEEHGLRRQTAGVRQWICHHLNPVRHLKSLLNVIGAGNGIGGWWLPIIDKIVIKVEVVRISNTKRKIE